MIAWVLVAIEDISYENIRSSSGEWPVVAFDKKEGIVGGICRYKRINSIQWS